MNRDEQEMSLWREAYFSSSLAPRGGREAEADAAVAEFRRRYPPQPPAPKAAWHDTPSSPGEYHVEGLPCVCWVDEDVVWCPDWDSANKRPRIRELPRNGRRVSPVTKPKEPQPVAPNAVWYDEPPFPKDGATRACWIAGGGHPFPAAVYWSDHEWRAYVAGTPHVQRIIGRRVCPIVKPPEPKQ